VQGTHEGGGFLQKKMCLFFLMGVLLLVCMGVRFGSDFKVLAKKNLALNFYNRVLELYLPQLVYTADSGKIPVYSDMAAALFPAFSYQQEALWYDSQTEEWTDYEELAALENEQMERMIEENEQSLSAENTNTEDVSTQVAEGMQDGSSAGGNSGNTGTGTDSTGTDGTNEGNTGTDNAGTDSNGSSDGTVDGTDSTSDPNQSAQAEEKKTVIDREKLNDYDYLRQNFYIVDSSTTIGSDQLNAEQLLSKDMTIDKDGDGPQILIYHTHSQEGYADSTEGDASTSVVAVGEYLAQILTEKYGFRVLHHTGEYDVGDRDHAYSNAAPALEEILKEYPSIQVVIDLHRDSIGSDTHLVTEINGKSTAKIMFFNGLCRTAASGNLTSLVNPYLEDNLAFSFQMQLAAAEYYPDFTRKIYLKGYRYNMHYCPKSLLVEVGAQNNTLEEAKNAMEPLADVLSKVLTGTE
jgi:stage II sporulation protein P